VYIVVGGVGVIGVTGERKSVGGEVVEFVIVQGVHG
jgi:hypothetical protein